MSADGVKVFTVGDPIPLCPRAFPALALAAMCPGCQSGEHEKEPSAPLVVTDVDREAGVIVVSSDPGGRE